MAASCERQIKLTVGILLTVATFLGDENYSPQFYSPPAETAQESSVRKALSSLLRASRYDELDSKANGLQREYENGKLNDINLLRIYRAFYDTDAGLESKYTQWLASYPRSYAARLSYGNYLKGRAYDLCSCDPNQILSPRQQRFLETLLDKAMEQYGQSLQLAKRPILTYHAILGVAMVRGDAKTARSALDSSIRIAPHNFVARYKYLITLETRWGGSLNQMVQFRDDAKHAGLSQEQLGYFDETIESERVWLNQTVRGR